MELESRSLPTDASRPLLVKVKEYKADLSALKEKLRTAAASAPMGDAARAELVSASASACRAPFD
jgi:hypothetical protein